MLLGWRRGARQAESDGSASAVLVPQQPLLLLLLLLLLQTLPPYCCRRDAWRCDSLPPLLGETVQCGWCLSGLVRAAGKRAAERVYRRCCHAWLVAAVVAEMHGATDSGNVLHLVSMYWNALTNGKPISCPGRAEGIRQAFSCQPVRVTGITCTAPLEVPAPRQPRPFTCRHCRAVPGPPGVSCCQGWASFEAILSSSSVAALCWMSAERVHVKNMSA
jgi:hypothetical protein